MKRARSTLHVAMLAALWGGSAAASERCPPVDSAGVGVETAVHVVFGPLPLDGDPAGIHRLEHLAVNGPQVACAEAWGRGVAGWTGPDTLHFVWRGVADDERVDAVVALLKQAAVEVEDSPEALAAVAAELEMERDLSTTSASMHLLHNVSARNTRYTRSPQGRANGSASQAVAEAQAAPMTVVVAQAGRPVRWHTAVPRTDASPAITPIERPPWATEAWRVEGTLDCTQRRAVWALVQGRAEALGGTAIGWMGRRGGTVGVSDATRTRAPRRRVVKAAQRWDQAAVRNTHRRARDLVDQTWMGVGHVGLGVCPSVDPLSTEVLRAAHGWLKGSARPTPGALAPPVGAWQLPQTAWGAVWQAGLPPDGWDADTKLFHTRTPGGYTVDGPAAVLAMSVPTNPAASPVPPEDAVEQALVLSGARTVEVPMRTLGLETTGVERAPSEGAVRVPAHNTILVVDTGEHSEHVRLDAVFATHGQTGLFAPGSSLRTPLDTDGRVRDAHVQPEGPRVRLSATLPMDHLAAVVAALVRPVEPLTPGRPDLQRAEARPWEAVRVAPTSTERGQLGPHVVVLHGPAEPILAALDTISVHADRVLTAAQLRAEAEAIR